MATTPGQPTSYEPQYVELAHNYCLLGATNEVLGDFFDVAPRTIDNWIAAVVRWLKKAGAKAETTREEVRRHALGKTVNAGQADLVLGGAVECGDRAPGRL